MRSVFYAQRLQMASDRANEELKRRFAREKREVRQMHATAEYVIDDIR